VTNSELLDKENAKTESETESESAKAKKKNTRTLCSEDSISDARAIALALVQRTDMHEVAVDALCAAVAKINAISFLAPLELAREGLESKHSCPRELRNRLNLLC
jgi:hypothetical protein